mmetsp:Transcript_51443/g.159565  ORF Transcript_51443/g.159565 Transcript_51443/m.159565 type:complete len:246 (+) Transcript_51443:307-1044(+)
MCGSGVVVVLRASWAAASDTIAGAVWRFSGRPLASSSTAESSTPASPPLPATGGTTPSISRRTSLTSFRQQLSSTRKSAPLTDNRWSSWTTCQPQRAASSAAGNRCGWLCTSRPAPCMALRRSWADAALAGRHMALTPVPASMVRASLPNRKTSSPSCLRRASPRPRHAPSLDSALSWPSSRRRANLRASSLRRSSRAARHCCRASASALRRASSSSSPSRSPSRSASTRPRPPPPMPVANTAQL